MVKGKRKIPCRMADFWEQKPFQPQGWAGAGAVTGVVAVSHRTNQPWDTKHCLLKKNEEQSILGRLGKSKLNDLIPSMDAQMPRVGIKGSRFETIRGVRRGGRGHADL